MKLKGTDMQTLKKKWECLGDAADALETALSDASRAPTKRVYNATSKQRVELGTDCTILMKTLLQQLRKRATECKRLSTVEALSLSQYIGDTIQEPELRAIVNSAEARDFKTAWTPLVNDWELWKLAQKRLRVPKYAYFQSAIKEAATTSNSEEIEADFSSCRDKLCEILAVRALLKPLKADETRAACVAAEMQKVIQLGGAGYESLAIHVKFTPPSTSTKGSDGTSSVSGATASSSLS